MKPHRFGTQSDAAAQRGWVPVTPDLDTLRAQAYSQGVARGAAQARHAVWQEAFDAGRAHGEHAAEARTQVLYAARLRDELDAIAQPLAALQAAREQVHARLAAGALDVVCDVTTRAVQAILQRELNTAPADIAGIVQRLLAQLSTSDHRVTVYVGPDDAQALATRIGGDIVDGSPRADGERAGWRIVADPSLGRGACRVDADGLWYDAGCDGRQAATHDIVRRRLSDWVDACMQAPTPDETPEARR
ncbi:flagellar assembly protein H [Pandoraea eparura]|uniref:Flagellar assembly protein FliH n=1 Tax=Pandoraea eparura TaxID=2508291 RepID=A0A5E4VCZ9_9BURK|nr:FliH/SctL family protein [Pandoraea eparura]VVE10016.1 flagellar assembly protein H [Pandoraea eparura]